MAAPPGCRRRARCPLRRQRGKRHHVLQVGASIPFCRSQPRAEPMSRSQQDVENLFASQGIPGRYRELARHPAPSTTQGPRAPSIPPAEHQSATTANAEQHGSAPRDGATLQITTASAQTNAAPPRRGLARLGLVMPAPRRSNDEVAKRPLNQIFAQLSNPTADGRPSAHSDPSRPPDSQRGESLRQLPLPALFAHLERNGKRG